MNYGDRQVGATSSRHCLMEGIVTGVAKRSHNPVVDGIITGHPKVSMPSVKTPTTTVHAFATRTPHAAFGSGVFGQGAGPMAGRAEHAEEKKPKGRGRPKKEMA